MQTRACPAWPLLSLLSLACLPVDQPGGDVEERTQAATLLGTYEAEAAVVVGAKVLNTSPGFTGTGYVDYQNASGDYLEWTINVPAAGSHLLGIRFANGATTQRSLQAQVNGAVFASALAFSPTGGWSTWQVLEISPALNAGTNKIRLTATGSNGPNIDHLKVYAQVQPPPQPVVGELGSPSDDNTPTWTWVSGGGTGNGTFRYKLDSVDFTTGTTTTTVRSFTPSLPLANGIHTLYVQERNAEGNWSATSVGSSVEILVHLPHFYGYQEAETAVYAGAIVATGGGGWSGDGYIDFQNASNDYVEFSPVVPRDGVYKVTFRYSNGATSSRPLKVTVNGVTVKASQAFPSTGSWSTWRSLNLDLPVPVGGKVRLTAIGSSGGNIDGMAYDSGTPASPAPLLQEPPIPSVTDPVTFSWTPQDPDGTSQFQYRLYTGVDGPWVATTARTVTFSGLQVGWYTFQVQQWNKWGAWGKAATGFVRVNPAPVVTGTSGTIPPHTDQHWSWTSGGGTGSGIYRYKVGGSDWSQPGSATQLDYPGRYPPNFPVTIQVQELDAGGYYWSLIGSLSFTVSE